MKNSYLAAIIAIFVIVSIVIVSMYIQENQTQPIVDEQGNVVGMAWKGMFHKSYERHEEEREASIPWFLR